MSEEVLAWMDTLLSGLGINYQYGVWSTRPVPFPYFVGEMDEDLIESEDGMQQCTFMLTGTGRSLLELERVKNKIKKLNDTRAILENGSGAVSYTHLDVYKRQLVDIGRHLGMFKDKLELDADMELNITIDYGEDDSG